MVYEVLSDSFDTGPPALPRAITNCRATKMNGELIVTGWSDDNGHIGELCSFVYRNSEWLDLAVPGAPAAVYRCEVASIFLG